MARAKQLTGICTVMIACDGASMQQGRDMCGKCRETLAKRAKQKPLRGDNCKALGSTLTERDLRRLER